MRFAKVKVREHRGGRMLLNIAKGLLPLNAWREGEVMWWVFSRQSAFLKAILAVRRPKK